MRTLKKRLGLWVLFGLLCAVLTYFIFASLGAMIGPGRSDRTAPSQQIALVHGPIHYDILLPLTAQTRVEFASILEELPADHPDANWLLVGWGAETFYTTVGTYSDVSFRALRRGVFGDNSVLRFDIWRELPDHPNVKRIQLNEAEFARLLNSVADDVAGPALPIQGFTATDRFFPAQGRFHLFQTCNVWVGEKLRDAGIGFGFWTPLPFAVTLSLWRFGHTFQD